jgi:putative heme transporter
MAEATTATVPRSRRRFIGPLVALIVIIGTFTIVLPRFANYGDVSRTIGNTSAAWGLALVAAGVLNIATYAPNWMASLPGLSYWRSLRVTLAGTAIANLAPFGGAVSMGVQYSMFRAWGFERSESSRAMVVTGIWNNLVNLGLPLTGLLLLTVRGGRNAALQVSAQIGAVIFVIVLFAFWQVLRSDAGAARVGRFADAARNRWLRLRRKPQRTGLDVTIGQFRRDSIDLLRRRWLAITLTTIVGVLTVFVVLVVAVRAVGIVGAEVTFTEAFAAWASTRLLSTAVPVTPGGLGVVDVALTSALTGFGGDTDKAVAAVLLYRAVTWLPPVILGAFASMGWRKKAANSLST